MSETSRWSYTNKATVWKKLAGNAFGGGSAWAPPFTIACTWTAGGKLVTDDGGQQFVSTCSFFHEDGRVAYGDMIVKGEYEVGAPVEGARPIRNHTDWDMSFFDDPLPDYRSTT